MKKGLERQKAVVKLGRFLCLLNIWEDVKRRLHWLGVVVFFFGIVGSLGCATRFSHTESTHAKKSDIWSLWTDVKQWPSWDTELKSSSLKGAFRDGATGILVPKSGTRSNFRVLRVRQYQEYTLEVDLPGAKLWVVRSLREKDGRLFLTHDVQFRGLMGWFFAGVLGGQYKRVLPKVMQKLKQMAERRSAVPIRSAQ